MVAPLSTTLLQVEVTRWMPKPQHPSVVRWVAEAACLEVEAEASLADGKHLFGLYMNNHMSFRPIMMPQEFFYF